METIANQEPFTLNNFVGTKDRLLLSFRRHAYTLPVLFFSFLVTGALVSDRHTPDIVKLIIEICFFSYLFISWGLLIVSAILYFIGKYSSVEQLLKISDHKIFYLVVCAPFLALATLLSLEALGFLPKSG